MNARSTSSDGSAFARIDALAYVPRATATFADVAAVMRSELATRARLGGGVRAPRRCFFFFDDGGRFGSRARVPALLSARTRPRRDGRVPPSRPGTAARRACLPDAGLGSVREALHWALCLPMDRPALRVGNAANVGSSDVPEKTSERLRNVHAIPPGLPASHVVGGTAALRARIVRLLSLHAGSVRRRRLGVRVSVAADAVFVVSTAALLSAPVPTHREIQECLCRIGDKPASFVGSKQWIGAIELSYVLDELLGMTCKIMPGAERALDLPSRGRELARHFDDVGTPIMMGGGQLAYTLLGVDYNELTGECAFLILDPHYTGGEDVKSIVPRWCGWKKCEDVFVKEFYNLLEPRSRRRGLV